MSWLLAFAGFALLIVLHEFGHFVAAKAVGMRVERFFLFFPPKLVSIRRGETEYGIGAIPLGGFVKITGMNPDEVDPPPSDPEAKDVGLLEKVESAGQEPGEGVSRPGEPLSPELRERAYYNQPVWKRIVVIAAGPAMNLLIAFVLLFALAMTADTATRLDARDIEEGSPAAGKLQEGDTIVSVDGITPTQGGAKPSSEEIGDRADSFATQINTHTCASDPPEDGCEATTPAKVVVERDGERETLLITPFYDAQAPGLDEGDDPGRYRLGFRFDPAGEIPASPSAGEAAEDAVDIMWRITSATVSVIARIIDPEQREQISGVVGGYEATRQAIDVDARLAIGIIALFSFSLALINLFPFLPLDGGHIFWSVVEKVRGRRVAFSVMEKSGAIGFVLILCLAFIGLTNDLDRIISGEGFGIR